MIASLSNNCVYRIAADNIPKGYALSDSVAGDESFWVIRNPELGSYTIKSIPFRNLSEDAKKLNSEEMEVTLKYYGREVPDARVALYENVEYLNANVSTSKKIAEWVTVSGVPEKISGLKRSTNTRRVTYSFDVIELPDIYYPEDVIVTNKLVFPDNGKYDNELYSHDVELGDYACKKVYGDANCDGEVNIADAVLIMQSLANPAKYTLEDKGTANADVNGGGLTAMDALDIQRYKLGLIEKLPVK